MTHVQFDPLAYPLGFLQPTRLVESNWVEHVPFGMVLIDLLRPSTVVELGTFAGVSFCCFCQALVRLKQPARAWAIDTWEGDPHQGVVAPKFFEELCSYVQERYGTFAELIRSTFDEACDRFAEGSIDLLHIDGYHTYEAVCHDYKTWLPKMSQRGVILFHDIAVRKRDFGVWQFWREVRQLHPAQEFYHGHGLGILQVGQVVAPGLESFLGASGERLQSIRKFYSTLGRGLRHRYERDRVRRRKARRKGKVTGLRGIGNHVMKWLRSAMALAPS